jgi:hypothetical protein
MVQLLLPQQQALRWYLLASSKQLDLLQLELQNVNQITI